MRFPRPVRVLGEGGARGGRPECALAPAGNAKVVRHAKGDNRVDLERVQIALILGDLSVYVGLRRSVGGHIHA